MSQVLIIARMTFLEARRNRISMTAVFFCVFIVLLSFIFQEVTLTTFDRVVRDVSLGTIQIFGTFLSIFLGVTVVNREIDRKTVYSILSKPVSRANFLLGKIVGLWFAVATSLGLMLITFLAENAFIAGPSGLIIFETFFLMLVEMLLLSSFSVMAGVFTSPVVSSLMAFALVFAGHLSKELYFFTNKNIGAAMSVGGKALFFLLPDLQRLNLKTAASLMQPVELVQVATNGVYGLAYAFAFFMVAVGVFSRRDLK